MSPNVFEFIGVLFSTLSTISTPIISPCKIRIDLVDLSQISDNEILSGEEKDGISVCHFSAFI
jgi:hypothetical protein